MSRVRHFFVRGALPLFTAACAAQMASPSDASTTDNADDDAVRRRAPSARDLAAQTAVALDAGERLTLRPTAYKGQSLPPKTVALTFDDGPGPRTTELSGYLRDEGIRAVFFVNGHCFDPNDPCRNTLTASEVFDVVIADGHMIGNHTQDHLDLTSATFFPEADGGDEAMVAELARTHAIIAPWIPSQRALFRPPYGYWDAHVAAVLEASQMSLYTGPVLWDVGGAMKGTDETTGYAADYDCWANSKGFGVKTSRQCAMRYLNEFLAVGRGISLMHDMTAHGDETNHDVDSGKGNTTDMLKVLVPLLKANGFSFARADEVPYIAAALPPSPSP